jgi:serine/threonine-protein kinase RsbW/sigma-B regulation protein RsbU (phosphoserine phosphatase)
VLRAILHLTPRLSEVARLNEWLEAQAAKASVPAGLVADMRLCLEEVITNVVSYAFDGVLAPEVTVEFEAGPDVLTAVVADNGRAFDPLDHPLAPRLSDLKTAPIGGFGIRLLRETASAVRYERLEGRNRLTITCRPDP